MVHSPLPAIELSGNSQASARWASSELRCTTVCVYKVEYMATAFRLVSPVVKRRTTSSPDAISNYAPLASVWYGDDTELLELLLSFYPRKKPRNILDATVNHGRFWKGNKRHVIGLDINPRYRPTVVGDNTNMPFSDGSFDVVVYDPPHIPNQGKDNSKDFNTRFGLVLRSTKENHYTFSHTFPPFVGEAFRVLKSEGILLCKITDYVHHHRYQWAHIDTGGDERNP